MAKANKKGSTAVAPVKGGAVAAAAPMGRGFEEADAESFAIPFLAVLQKQTPWADPDDAAYIKGAKPGMFINTVTLELYDQVDVIPCAYQRRFNRWAPRDLGGGFKGAHLPSAIAGMEAANVIKASEEGRLFFPLPDGSINEKKCDILTDTRMHFCLLVKGDGKLEGVLISLSRTQLKKSKQWMTLMQNRGGDMFSTVYQLSTRDEENDKGKWKGVAIEVDRPAEAEEVNAGANFYASVIKGVVKVNPEQEKAQHAEAE
jgi:hypothetical protein